MRYGASHPRTLVERAADHGQQALALTDRDGVYGAVKFLSACSSAGIRPILGVDLAIAPASNEPSPRRAPGPAPRLAPARGGAYVDPGYPRITLLARDLLGWAASSTTGTASSATSRISTTRTRPSRTR